MTQLDQDPMSVDTSTPLSRMTEAFPQTALWNDSADPEQLRRSIGFGAVGATCNPVIALAAINADLPRWTCLLYTSDAADE